MDSIINDCAAYASHYILDLFYWIRRALEV